jgi:hypothetical protein
MATANSANDAINATRLALASGTTKNNNAASTGRNIRLQVSMVYVLFPNSCYIIRAKKSIFGSNY